MKKLTRTDLLTLEDYARQREQMRRQVLEHKRTRRLSIGPIVNLYFEDRLTMHYQVQEMLRAERIFEAAGIDDELNAYNPLIPDGTNWKATMMIEIPDEDQRKQELAGLVDIENRCYVQVEDHEPVYSIADEDMDRSTADKTSSVHFLRFELDSSMISALRDGKALHAGIDHPSYTHQLSPVPSAIRQSLLRDLDQLH
ncbi:MAG: DUF3501 family protein [Gammaproteobacteria bacterium]|nr:DUF3501 family protein [Gammaproteobacteria bacterium]